MRKYVLLIGICVVLSLVLAFSFVHVLLSDQHPGTGFLAGNIIITNSADISEYQYQNLTEIPLFIATSKDGLKLSYVIFAISEGNRTTFNVSMDTGHYLLQSHGNYTPYGSNITYVGRDLPKTITIDRDRTTYLDLYLDIVPNYGLD
jgi:hypothetical protein